MSGEEKISSRKITSLDLQAEELGIGGNLSPETDERLYKKRMQKRKDVQLKRLKVRKAKKGLLINKNNGIVVSKVNIEGNCMRFEAVMTTLEGQVISQNGIICNLQVQGCTKYCRYQKQLKNIEIILSKVRTIRARTPVHPPTIRVGP